MKRWSNRLAWGGAACCLALSTMLAPAWAGTVKVGAIFAVTGPASFLGGPEARSAEMVVEKINHDDKRIDALAQLIGPFWGPESGGHGR